MNAKYQPGSIGEMVAVSLPMVVSFACDTVMIFTDRIFLSKLGPQGMSAAMAGGLSVFVLMAFFLGLIGYTTALVAQYYGAGKKGSCSLSLMQAVIVACVAYPVILALVPVAHWVFSISGIDLIELKQQKQYFNILVLGAILPLLRHALSAFFTGIGRTRVVMIAAVMAMLVNVGLNYIFVFGKFGCPSMGIKGAALGTVIATSCAVVYLLVVYLSPKLNREFLTRVNFRFDKDVMGKLWRFGCPGGVEMLFNLLAFTAMVFVLHSEGVVAAAATTIVFNWDMVTFIPLLGIEIGVTSLVGRYMGEQNVDVVKRVVVSGLKMGMVYAVGMMVVFIFFPVSLVYFFEPNHADVIFNQAVPLAIAMIKLVAFYVTAQAVLMVFIGALRGAGDTMWAMRISVGIHWVILVILYVMLKVNDATVYQSWLVLVIVFMVLSITPFLRYQSGRWKSIQVINSVGD